MKSVKLIQQLIEIPSLSGDEEQIINFIKQHLTDYGLKTEKIAGNLVCHVQGVDPSKSLIFNAHVDTVPAGNENLWEHGPFSGRVVGDRVYGLGASDEKAGVAGLMLLASKLVDEKPAGDVWLHFVTKEEVDGLGSRETMKTSRNKRVKKIFFRDLGSTRTGLLIPLVAKLLFFKYTRWNIRMVIEIERRIVAPVDAMIGGPPSSEVNSPYTRVVRTGTPTPIIAGIPKASIIRINTIRAAFKIEGVALGRVTVQNRLKLDAPRLCAASSRVGSMV